MRDPADAPFVIEEDYYIRHESWYAWEIFLACQTQWQRNLDGSINALNYPALLAVMDLYGNKDKDTFHKIKCLETGALRRFREKRHDG